MNTNEEHADQSGFSLMAKRSEINLPNHQELEYSQVYGCFAANPQGRLKVLNKSLLMLKPMILKKKWENI